MTMLKRNVHAVVLAVLCVGWGGAYAFEIDTAALYRFEEEADAIAVGQFLTDSSGNERHAEAFGGVIGLVAGQAKLGQAGSFNQSLAFVDLKDVDTSGDFTFAFWMKSATLGQTQKYLLSRSNGSGGGEQTAVIYQYEQNTVELYSGNSGTNLRPGSQLSVPDTEWHHIVYTRSGSAYDAYLDGQKRDIATLDGQVHNPQYLSIGGTNHLRDGGAVNLYEGLLDDVLVMTQGVTQDQVDFMMRGFTNELAHAPSPEDGADDVLRDHVLSWEPGMYAVKHNVYLGTDFDDVNDAGIDSDLFVGHGQADASYDAGALDFGQTYYWRVDEVNAAPDYTVFPGNVWSFTVEPVAYAIEGISATYSGISLPGSGPENTVNGSGLNDDDQHSVELEDMWLSLPGGVGPDQLFYEFDKPYSLYEMWVWNGNVEGESAIGFGLKDVTVEYSLDGADWTLLGEEEFTPGTGTVTYTANTVVAFGGVITRYVRLTINSSWISPTQHALSEVRFLHVPLRARKPEPAANATDVHPEVSLNWRAGRQAAQHDVYLDTDEQAVIDGTAPAATVSESACEAQLDLGQTYYWKVNEVNDLEDPATWEGDTWSFATMESLVVDDFESYTNDSPNRVFQTWIDGIGFSADPFFPDGVAGNDSGALVGHDIWNVDSEYFEGQIVEVVRVHGGRQSMPLYYDNTGGVTAAEATRTFATAQNWSANGVRSLTLSFFGTPDNTGELYVKINNTQIAYKGDPDNIAVNIWHTWSIDLTTVNGIDNVTSLTLGVAGANAAGTVYIDDICLSPQEAVVEDLGNKLVVSAYEWAPGGFLANTPAMPDYWGSDVDMTKLTDGVIASDYSGGLCAGWNYSTADAAFGPTLYFDLGSIQNIGAVAIYHQPRYYGFETVTVSVSSLDNPNRLDTTDMTDWTGEEIHESEYWGDGDSGNAPSVMQIVPIRQEGRWVRLQFLNQEPGYDTAWTMFSEFTFYSE